MIDLQHHLLSLEESLLDPQIRGSADPYGSAGSLLADDFTEFGSSGKVYGKAQTLAALHAVPGFAGGKPPSITDFRVRLLPSGGRAALVTYRISADATQSGSWRSSIWEAGEDGRWRLVFHQGTPLAQKAAPEPPL